MSFSDTFLSEVTTLQGIIRDELISKGWESPLLQAHHLIPTEIANDTDLLDASPNWAGRSVSSFLNDLGSRYEHSKQTNALFLTSSDVYAEKWV